MTKKFIAEQVLLKLKGFPSIADKVKIFDLYPIINQAANTLLKAQYVNGLALDEIIPDNSIITTYPAVPISPFGESYSTFTLPATPISLPRNMGVWAISVYEDFRELVIPLRSGQFYFLKSMELINDITGLYYEVNGRKVTLFRNVTDFGFTEAYVKLMVMDFSQYADTETLPLPPEIESIIIQQVLQIYSPTPETLRISDPYQVKQKV